MKKTFVFSLVAFSLWLMAIFPIWQPYSSTSFAQEENPTATPAKKKEATPAEKSKIEEIKEKIASTVAQLNLVSKKGFVGRISKLEKTQFTIEKNEKNQIIEIYELTKYETVDGNKRKEARFEDLDVDDRIVAMGLYNKDSEKLLARIILLKVTSSDFWLNGIVREVDIKGGTISLEDKNRGKTYVVDIEKSTTTTQYSNSGKLIKSGLSKIEIGQRAHVYGTLKNEEEKTIVGKRILLLPQRLTTTISPTTGTKDEEENTPTPTKKPSATAKPKNTPLPTEESSQ